MGGEKPNDWNNYLDHIGLWFFFCGCAGVSVIVWVFNWVCWVNQCCCCDFLHNPVNKRIAWWMSFSFLMGIFACCISAFYTVNRFGFALEGAWCAIDRIYYDSLYGQLKDTEDRWDGIKNTKNILDNIYRFCKKLIDDTNDNNKYWHGNATKIIENSNSIDDINKTRLELITSLYQLEGACNSINKNSEKLNETDFEKIGEVFLKDFDYYAKTLKACLKILSMIYYCILLVAVSAAAVSMMFYACLKRQGYLITFMHVLWNVIRFFMFSFFLYGTAYGIGFLAIRDSIAVINRIFGENKNILGGGTEFLEYCLRDSDTNMLSEQNINAVKNFFSNIGGLMNGGNETGPSFISLYNITCTDQQKVCNLLESEVEEGGFKKSFDCGFLKSDLSHLYRTLSDASVESRILAALSLCSSFFGAVAVYFFLLVMHHYNNELFFDSGKSIFTGFDGFGGGYKKKVHEKDPAYKKRKLRAEVEMTSKNDEQSAYNNANKNEDGE